MSVAVVTGANRGIGLHLVKKLLAGSDAHEFMKPHFKIIATARTPEAATELNDIAANSDNRVVVLPLDINSESSVEAFTKSVTTDFGHIDLAFFNAGVIGEKSPVTSLSKEDAVNTFITNAYSPIHLFNSLLPCFRAGTEPRVIFVSTAVGSIGNTTSGTVPSYRASKVALNMLVRCLSIEVPEVAMMLMHPGWVATDMGGPNATTQPEDSAAGIISVATKFCNKEHSADKLYVFNGNTLPW
jgi:NAD(P)-dependent dehydrogenase (short-subunit alcohol dehydrogenase family)